MSRRIGIFHGRPASTDQIEIGADVSVNQHSSGAATPSPLSCVEATLRLNEMLNRLAWEM